MGIYVNPGNSAFQRINNSEYVDKTKLIDLINARIGTNNNLVCISRPRRFGKSFAAQTLSAYYDCSLIPTPSLMIKKSPSVSHIQSI